jgi:hypothetical protein
MGSSLSILVGNMIRKIHTISIFAVLVFTISISIPGVYAITTSPAILVSPNMGPDNFPVTVSGTGFTPNTTVVIFFGTNFADTAATDGSGSFSKGVNVPTLTPVGPTTVNVYYVGSTVLIASAPFTVTSSTSIPEFPFSFNLVIIFVAVAAVYMVIRQKMATNLKPF